MAPLSSSSLDEAPPPTTSRRGGGGWITAPFIIVTMFGLTLAATGWINNLIVFLINNFHVKTIDAAQINNVVSGCVNFFPLVGAIIADSLLSCFSVIWISSLISLLGLILLLLTVTVESLKPDSTPSTTQYAVLYSALALVSIGVGGTRFTLATMGANQLKKFSQHSSFFDWYFFGFYSASFIGATGIVYVEDNMRWSTGFLICIAANVVALALFLSGSRYYTREERRESPFTGLFRVLVASVRKRKAVVSSQSVDYYHGDEEGAKGVVAQAPTKRFRALNRAALKTENDTGKICTVQQVEDLKSLITILPLWSTSIFLGTPIGVQLSLTVLQALAADRRITPTFTFPAAFIIVFSFLSTAVTVALIDHCLRPLYARATSTNLTPLQQIGAGHVLTVASMAISSVVESRRRRSAAEGHVMSVVWLVPQMVVVGMGEGFHLPGQVGLYYQEFPASLKSLSTAMVAMLIGVAFYMSSVVVGFVRRATEWLPDDVDRGRLDFVYWVVVGIGVVNFGYFLVVSWFYECKDVGDGDKGEEVGSGDQA